MKILKQEKGSITLFVLIAMLFFVMYLVGMYILSSNTESTQIAEAARIKEIYEEGVNNIDDVYATLTDVNNKKADGSWIGTVNTPKLKGTGLIPVYWNGTTWVDLTSTSSQTEWDKWYDYEEKKWANARSKDGSMWVWIPRYEYCIDATNQTITVNFIPVTTKAGSPNYNTDNSTGLISTTRDGKTYIIHPAFMDDRNKVFDNGGWDKEIEGFWVAKYVAGYQYGQPNVTVVPENIKYSNLKYTSVNSSFPSNYYTNLLTTNTNLSYPIFKTNTYAYNLISAGDAYRISKEIDGKDDSNSKIQEAYDYYGLSNIDSHLQKNSEWGAVAYLTHSQYGVNGNSTNMNEVAINSKNLANSIYVNNATSGNVGYIYGVTGYGYDTISNTNLLNYVDASSTKNMTGVFDLSGCVWEYKASYYKTGTSSTPISHSAMADSSTALSTKYVTLYTSNNKKGDATNETSGWNSDINNFVTANNPVFARGGSTADKQYTGPFAFFNYHGGLYVSYGFRVVLIAD